MKKRNFTLWLLQRFSEFRRLRESNVTWIALYEKLEKEVRQLKKKAESDAALIESLNRYIEALEGRDKERVARIEELKNQCLELREHLSGILPPQHEHKEELPP